MTFTIAVLDLRNLIVSTITTRPSAWRYEVVGQLIMLGTLFGLIVLIYGLVIYFDPEARGNSSEEPPR
jgi:hypothetical protein